jgi:1-acyl-sn-glycerol-3-phosphate acyltransferase
MADSTSERSSTTLQTRTDKALTPARDEIAVLGPLERFGFWLSHRMNIGFWKSLMTAGQRHLGSLWIYIATYNLMNVFGLENVADADPNVPILLVANHRSFFDMYTVSSIMFRRTQRPIRLYFPVRGKFFYDNPVGWFVNLVMGWFSMYPPFFRETGEGVKREFDKYSLRRLIQLCSQGTGHIIGFHPEGRRNLSGDAYSFLPAQPGVGKVIYAARPKVVPVFIAGLGNDLPKQIAGNWTGGDKIRLWFGEPIDLSRFYEMPDKLRTHKAIADHLMEKIGELGEKDRSEFA